FPPSHYATYHQEQYPRVDNCPLQKWTTASQNKTARNLKPTPSGTPLAPWQSGRRARGVAPCALGVPPCAPALVPLSSPSVTRRGRAARRGAGGGAVGFRSHLRRFIGPLAPSGAPERRGGTGIARVLI